MQQIPQGCQEQAKVTLTCTLQRGNMTETDVKIKTHGKSNSY